MKDLIAKLQMNANCALGAIWIHMDSREAHIDAQAARIAELEAQQAFGIGETYANALSRIAELEAQIAASAETDKLREAIFMAGIPTMAINGMNNFSSWEIECWARGALAMRVAVLELMNDTALQAPVREVPEPNPDRVEWIVNDMGELGVRVDGICYFCYKGESLVYESGKHDDGTPILHRNVGKREFGEVVYPATWQAAGRREPRYRQELVYTPGLSFGSPEDPKYKWVPLPAAPVQEPKP